MALPIEEANAIKDMNMEKKLKMASKHLHFYYGDFEALHDVSLEFYEKQVTSLIGPSGCGKSTFLRCMNRMNDLIPNTRVEGQLLLDSADIYAPSVDVVSLRNRIGMVFQKPNPFPKSIFENVAYGLRVNGVRDRDVLQNGLKKASSRRPSGKR
jgi:phosphate transport system ATP-binding protein